METSMRIAYWQKRHCAAILGRSNHIIVKTTNYQTQRPAYYFGPLFFRYDPMQSCIRFVASHKWVHLCCLCTILYGTAIPIRDWRRI